MSDLRSCGGCMRGSPYEGSYTPETQCRICFLYSRDERFRAHYNGSAIPPVNETTIQKWSELKDETTTEISTVIEGVPLQANVISTEVRKEEKPLVTAVSNNKVKRGPGAYLEVIILELGLKGWAGCPCVSRARQMDQWGVEGCKLNREVIIGWLKEAQAHLTWGDKLKLAKKLVFKVNWIDPVGSILDEAINRASQQ